jgi:hypothetical protein
MTVRVTNSSHIVVTSETVARVLVSPGVIRGPQGEQGESPEVSRYLTGNVTLSSSTLTLNLSTATSFYFDLDRNVTTVTLTNRPDTGEAQRVALYIEQANGGGWGVTGWPSGTVWPDGEPADLSTTDGHVDCVVLDVHGSSGPVFATMVGQNYR